jgi:hypothetical protein
MGFALWIDGDLAWAQGVHEYRPMGTAVIGVNNVFRHRDFHSRRSSPRREGPHYVGLFASVVDLNAHMGGRSRLLQKTSPARLSPSPPWI